MAKFLANSEKPLVSVVMSAYNAAEYVRGSVDSILNQTFTDFEFIIIDDGSTDDTKKIIRNYSDKRIKLISRENKGLIYSLNEGIASAKGRYIARQDADDVSAPDRLQRQVEEFSNNPKLVLVSTAFDMFDNSPERPIDVQILPYMDVDLRNELRLRNPFGHGSCMFALSAYQQVGGYRDAEMVEDYDLWVRMSEIGELHQVPEVLYHWRVLSGGITDVKSVPQAEAAAAISASLTMLAPDTNKQVLQRYSEYQKWVDDNGYPVVLGAFVVRYKTIAARLLTNKKPAQALQYYSRYRVLKKVHGKRKRVLVVRNAFLGDFGGAETYALNLSKVLSRNLYEPIIVSQVPELLAQAKSSGIEAIYGRWNKEQGWSKSYLLKGSKTFLWYIKQIITRRVGVLHLQSRDDFLFGTLAGRIFGKTVIWTDHGDLKYILRESAPPSLRKPMLFVARHAKKIIAVSNSEKSEIEQDYTLPNLQVIYNGVIQQKASNPVNHPDGMYVIGSTSRLVDSKGITELIEAFALMEQPKLQLWLVGDGNDRDKYEKMVRQLGLQKKVTFWGQQPNVWDYLAAFDVFVMPTYHEAFSLSLIEATVSGLPIICTEVGGNPEIAGLTKAQLVPAKDTPALASAVNAVITNPKKFQIDTKLKAKLATQFDFYRIVKEEVIPLYEKTK